MRGELGAAIDRRLAGLILIRLRRAWPLLRLVPASWIIPVVAPGARRLRRTLSTAAVSLLVAGGTVLVLISVRA
jgi:hypothetical protein